MATLVEVFAELFRPFGYEPRLDLELEGTTGRRHRVALLLEKDSRRLAVALWLHRSPLGPSFVREFIDAVKDTGCDGGLIASLGATPETVVVEAGQNAVAVWDSRRIAQELGNAVLRETCSDVWDRNDPWSAPRPSTILEQVQQNVLHVQSAAAREVPAPVPTVPDGTPPVEAEALASEPAPETLQLPLAFGVLDDVVAPAGPVPAAATAIVAPVEVVPRPAARPSRNILRLQVNRALATNLAKAKTRTVDRLLLRLVPCYVFDYEASLLVEGSLQSEMRAGRMAVDAATKRVREWTVALDVAEPASEGADVDEKPVRLAEADARKLLSEELRTLVTRDVVMEEDDSEWSVVVKKKVELAEQELRLTPHGVFYVPVWRASGRDGSIEIDALNGQILQEELTVAKSDALLI